MKEELYTIPVNDIFDRECECPICEMKRVLDEDAVSFAMGSSYMQDDIRMITDEVGFCQHHIQLMYKVENRLGLALMLDTHMKRVIKDVEKLAKKGAKSGGFFSKKEESPLTAYTNKLSKSCYLCDRIEHTYDRYVATMFYLYENDSKFVEKFRKCKGFCLEHYGMLRDMAPDKLSGNNKDAFIKALDEIFMENFKRVEEDVAWFIEKYDYRNHDKPWKNSKDAIIRAINKVNSIPYVKEEEK